MQPGRVVSLAAACLLLAACAAPDAEEPVRIDLARLFAVSDAGSRTAMIDLVDPADPRQLVFGWGEPASAADDMRGVPIAGAQSAVAFRAGSEAEDTTLVVDRMFVFPAGPHRMPESVRVAVNGAYVGRLDPDARHAELTLPRHVLKRGRNVLAFRILKRPREDPAQPTAGVLYRTIELRTTAPDRPEPRSSDDGGTLVFPPLASAALYFRVPRAARLAGEVRGDGARVTITVEQDGRETATVFDQTVTSDVPLDLPLPLDADAFARIGVSVDVEQAEIVDPRIVGTTRRASPASTAPVAPSRPNVLLYVTDALRADELGVYGSARGASPELDRFSTEAIVFERAIAQAPWTRPSVASVLTGLHPDDHGAIGLQDRLGPHAPMLGEILAGQGYRTGAFVTNVNVSQPFGFQRGFAEFRYLPEDPSSEGVHVPARRLHDEALAWLDTASDRPFFGYVHATDPHSPYRPSDELAARYVPGDLRPTIDPKDPHARLRARSSSMTDDDLALLRALYDAEIAYLDAEFGRLVGALRDRGLLDRTIVVFVADHGEEFRDHGGFEHGAALYQESVHVPLIIRLPGGGGRRTSTLAQHVDLMPTLLHLLGVPAPAGLPGRALVEADGGVIDRPDVEAMTSTRFARAILTALVVPPWKIMLSEHAGVAPQVFDLENDPGERQDVAGEHAVLVGYARQRVAELEAAMTPARGEAQPPLDPAVRERLRRLGYVLE